MKHTSLVAIIIFLSLQTSAQVNAITTIGAGYQPDHIAIPIQLTAGINIGKSELVTGYTVFFHAELPHKGQGGMPEIFFLRYGLNILKGDLEIVPLVGAGLLTPYVYGEKIIIKDQTHVHELLGTSQEFKLLYGLKVQKAIGLGGLFASYEHCKLSYFNIGIFVRIDSKK